MKIKFVLSFVYSVLSFVYSVLFSIEFCLDCLSSKTRKNTAKSCMLQVFAAFLQKYRVL